MTMTDSTNTQDQGTQGQVQDQGSATEATPVKMNASKAEAEAIPECFRESTSRGAPPRFGWDKTSP